MASEHYCYGCEYANGYRVRHDVVFTDSRTGRSFCHEHASVLISWELLDSDHPDKLDDPDGFAWALEPDEEKR